MAKLQPHEHEMFFFGQAMDKFAVHKAARIVGIFERPGKQGKVVKCYRLQYPDGEIAHAELVEESQGAFELLNHEDAVQKYGEEAFE